MLSLSFLGAQIKTTRKALHLSQSELAGKAGISRATLDALENGRSGELGFLKISRILMVLGLELRIHDAVTRRPTLDELLAEQHDDQSMDRRH